MDQVATDAAVARCSTTAEALRQGTWRTPRWCMQCNSLTRGTLLDPPPIECLCYLWEFSPQLTSRRARPVPFNQLCPELPEAALVTSSTPLPTMPSKFMAMVGAAGVKLTSGKMIEEIASDLKKTKTKTQKSGLDPLTSVAIQKKLQSIVPRDVSKLLAERRAKMASKSGGIKDSMAAKAKALARAKMRRKLEDAIGNANVLTLDDLKKTLDLVEIDLASAAPVDFADIVAELRRCNKEQRSQEMTDWASARALAVKYLLHHDQKKPPDPNRRFASKEQEQERLVWAQSERKLQWRVLESVIKGQFASAAFISNPRNSPH